MTDQRSPLDAALDLVLYVPLGLALTVSEEIPKLAAKGRSTLGARVTTARVVGQFAVAQGKREVSRRTASPAAPAQARPPVTPAGGPPVAPAGGPPSPTAVLTAKAAARGAAMPTATPPAATAPQAVRPAPVTPQAVRPAPTTPPAAGALRDLAIPGYDSLSASQVVQRLAGLSGAELEAVKDYESANRGRRTILARVGQLQGH